jgi:cytochrome c-type biogenesis protein CcmH
MELFWLISILLTLCAVFIVIRPMLKSRPDRADDNEQLRISIYRENLQELDSEFSSGQLDPGELENVKNELELSLLRESAVHTRGKETQVTSKRPLLLSLVAAMILVGLSLILYSLIGNPQLIALEKFDDITSGEDWNSNPHPDQMIKLLESHLQRNPEDANGLYFLANSYLANTDYQNAVTAFERLYLMTGDNTQVMLAYADTLVRMNNGSFAGRATDLIHRVLSVDPGNYTALLFAGLAAEETGNYRDANGFYSKLLPALENQPEMLQTINLLIANNKTMMGMAGSAEPTADETTPMADDPAGSIKLQVSVSAELIDQYGPDDTLFIYAQAAQGSPMPLAVVRVRADGLPMQVTLDDSLAMIPTNRLSNHEVVRIQARISKSGNAEPSSGDILGVLEQVSVADTNIIDLVINQVVP